MTNQPNKLVTASALLLLLGSTAALAGRGDIDSAFGVDGRIRGTVPVVSTPDDHFVSCSPTDGGFAVRRFDADGRLDVTFGNGGEIDVPLPAGATPAMGACQLVSTRGGLLFAGYLRDAGGNRIREVVLRIDTNGKLDTGFGGHGDGIYRLTNTSVVQVNPWIEITMVAITVDASARILIAVRRDCSGHTSVVRLTPNGESDATFGTNGRAELPGVIDLCSTAVLLGARDDGSVVVAVRGFIAGLDPSGALDAAFGVNGLVTDGVPDSDEWLGRMLPDGGALIIGNRRESPSANSELRKFDRRGRLDGSFGGGTGVMSLALGKAFTGDAGAHISAGNFVVEPDGSHMYVQLTVVRGGDIVACRSGIARLAMDGTPDVTFGEQGLTCLDYGAFSFWLAAVQTNGAPLFMHGDLYGTSLYRLLLDDTPSRGMLTLVLAEPWIHVRESDGHAAVTAARVAGRDGAVGARYSTGYPPFDDLLYPDGGGDGTGLATATDYQPVSGQLDWADGDDSWRTVSVPILNDDVAENRDILGILISEPRGGVIVDSAGTNIEIDDDDPSVAPPPPPANPPPANPPPSASGGHGGGGSSSWVTLLGLLGLTRVRHARASGGPVSKLQRWHSVEVREPQASKRSCRPGDPSSRVCATPVSGGGGSP